MEELVIEHMMMRDLIKESQAAWRDEKGSSVDLRRPTPTTQMMGLTGQDNARRGSTFSGEKDDYSNVQ